jgi:DNA-binding LacI/PurR family transcriptional regulator
MVRLKDIAAQAGVSMMTVSKALRDAPDVSAATKARVQALADQLGYVPDSSAQGLRTRSTRLFGLIVPTITNPVFARLVLAIEERTYELGYDLLYAHTLNLIQREETSIRHMLARRVEGLFIFPVHRLQPEARIYQELLARRLPVVLLGQPAPYCSQFPSVAADDEAGSYAAAQHLLQLGHRRIAFLTGPIAAPWAKERLDGFRRALREAGLELDDSLLFPAGSTIEDGEKAARQLLAEARSFTAVQAPSDLVAIGCARTLLDRGVRIPHDVSIIGSGNILSAEYFRVPLTTLRQPKRRLGNAAMDLMSKLLRGQPAESVRLPVPLSVRASTAAPPSLPAI